MKRLACKPFLARSIRAGLKTETRRLVWPQPAFMNNPEQGRDGYAWGWPMSDRDHPIYPAYAPGQVVEIVEPWCVPDCWDELSGNDLVGMAVDYGGKPAAKKVHLFADGPKPAGYGRFRQARFMPPAFVRTTVRILTVDCSRVQAITEAQAIAEGVERGLYNDQGETPGRYLYFTAADGPGRGHGSAVEAYAALWDSLHATGKRAAPWKSDPFVWRYTFELATARHAVTA